MSYAEHLSSLSAVRALSEGHAPKRVLKTEPFVDGPFAAPRATSTWEDDNPPVYKTNLAASDRCFTASSTITAWVEEFRQHVGAREFKTSELAGFLVARGWKAKHPRPGASDLLRRLSWDLPRRKALVEAVSESRGRGSDVVWKFTSVTLDPTSKTQS